MQIICPSCSTENKIEYGENIVCAECKKSFSGHTYKRFKKPLMSAVTALIIGAIGAHSIDKEYMAESRYPVDVEYELIDSCVNTSESPMNTDWRIKKTNVCVCALKRAMKAVTYNEFEKSEPEFLARFRAGVASCR